MNLQETDFVEILSDLNLLEKFSSDIKDQIISTRAKEFSQSYRASLINLLARLNDKKEALIKMEEDKNKTPEMLAQEAIEDSEAAYRLHKKFQSGLEIKAK
jgi:predicted Holliday junction resolvase-like endonuclease